MEEPIPRRRRTVAPGQSLAERFPDIAKQWDFEKNGDIRPSTISFGSDFVAYWIHGGGCGKPGCDEVHRWKASINSRTRMNGAGCPQCQGVRAFCPCKSLAINFPHIAAQWDHERNELTPHEVSFGQNLVVWWIHQGGCRLPGCTEEVHRWKASIYKRVRGGGCLPCSTGGTGKNFCPCRSLARRFPAIAEEWDYVKNGDDTHPEALLPGSHEEVHWKHPCPNPECSEIHEWSAAINNRALHGNGCPKCASGGTGQDFCSCRSLAKKHPEIAAEWDFERNGDRTPSLFLPGAVVKVFWIHRGGCGEPGCTEVHRWEAYIHNRVSGKSCPLCRGSNGFCPCRSLARRYPEISAEWHPTKNGASKPEDFSYGCGDKVWWLCPKDHEWDASINSRTSGSGCPRCNTNKAEKRLRELAEGHSDIMDVIEKPRFKMDVPGVPGKTRNLEPDYMLIHRDARKVMIELDGEQHFQSVSYWGGKPTNLQDQMERDRTKNAWAGCNGYSILRVSYLEYNRLDEIFAQFMEDWSKTERVIRCTNKELYDSQGDTWSVLDGL